MPGTQRNAHRFGGDLVIPVGEFEIDSRGYVAFVYKFSNDTYVLECIPKVIWPHDEDGHVAEEQPAWDVSVEFIVKSLEGFWDTSLVPSPYKERLYETAVDALDCLLSEGTCADYFELKKYLAGFAHLALPRATARLHELFIEYIHTLIRDRKAQFIQGYWRNVISDPSHPLCKRRLLREFYELSES